MALKSKIYGMFDIVSAVSTGGIEVAEIDLKSRTDPDDTEVKSSGDQVNISLEARSSEESSLDELVTDIINSDPWDSAKEELAAMLEEMDEPVVELAKIGALVKAKAISMSKPMFGCSTPKQSKSEDEEFYNKIIAHIQTPVTSHTVNLASVKSPIRQEYVVKLPGHSNLTGQGRSGTMVADFYQKTYQSVQSKRVQVVVPVVNKKPFNFAPEKKKNFSGRWLVVLALAGVFAYGFTLKYELVKDSSLAIDNLQQAKTSMESFDFSGAATSFQKSYQDFTQASQNLNMIGAGFADILLDIPGLGKLKSAKNLVEAGKLLAKSGQEMSEALSTLAKTGSILNPYDSNKIKPSKVISQLQDALALSVKNFDKAKALISNVDEAVIPEDKRSEFLDFKDKIPLLEKTLADAVNYTDFLQGVIGLDKPKKYLLLFNNYSELRPTGGFPGTYGVIYFSSGGLANFSVDDVYNLDGQLKKNIVPPKQLQHITPTWGMRDAAWFIDFPSSAKKTMSFFDEEAGYGVDGVITLNPEVVSNILKVVGPINMPQYGMTLTADNFMTSIQEEVEYGDNRIQPKRVVVDFAPRLLEKLYSASSDDWMKIFTSLIASLDSRDIMFYFNDKDLEKFAIDNGFGGEIKNIDADYLNVNFSNVKGSKADFVTDSSITIDNRIESGKMIHKVTIIRQHNGGHEENGFYNKQNPAYVRVLLPENADFISISGNDMPNYRPLISYGADFERDRDLEKLESSVYFDKTLNIDKYEDSGMAQDLPAQAGKNGIGFWMITDPGKTKKVEFEYSVPLRDDYNFYFQKQPGLDWKNFVFKISGLGGHTITKSMPEMNHIGGVYLVEEELKKDFGIKLNIK